MRKAKWLGTVVAFVLVASLVVTGCARPEPAAPAPAAEQEAITWVMQDFFAQGILLSEGGKQMAETLESLVQTPNYRLEINYHYAGEIVPSAETLSGVESGAIDCMHGWTGFWKGKDSAFALFASFPLGMNQEDFTIWLYEGGGQELCDEFAAQYNLKGFMTSAGGIESGMWTNVKMTKVEDYEGLKVRVPGFGEDVISACGAETVALPPEDIYLGMDRGIVDGIEFSYPCCDVVMGFCEVAKYWVAPAWWQPMNIQMFWINLDTWNALPDELKPLVEAACVVNSFKTFAYFEYRNIAAIKEIEEYGTEITKISPEAILELVDLTNELLENEAAKNPWFAKIAKSQYQFLKDYNTWRWMMTPFGHGMVRDKWPDFVE